MEHFKLDFRNLSAGNQIQLCEARVKDIARLPKERRKHVELADVQAKVAAARASHDRIAELRTQLKAEIAARKTLLGNMRRFTRDACNMATYLAESKIAAFAEIGLDKATGRKLPVGVPAALTNLRADSPDDGCARLRWKRSVRRCCFDVQMAANPSDEANWKPFFTATRQSCVLKDLMLGSKCWFRVRAFNVHGHGPWSQPVSVRVK